MPESWDFFVTPPVGGRLGKPRDFGVTMLIDKGLSLGETRNLLELGAPHIDFLKLSFGTIALYPPKVLAKKAALAAEYHVAVYPGGTYFEICYWRGQWQDYFYKLLRLGLEWVEISDGTLDLTQSEREQAIRAAKAAGLKVITEVGKKNPCCRVDEWSLAESAERDLELGASWVIIESRESGHGIGIYDQNGAIIEEKLQAFSDRLPQRRILWEAPLKNQQARLINDFGPNVNLGNIQPSEALALEALRLGLRSDTWRVETPELSRV